MNGRYFKISLQHLGKTLQHHALLQSVSLLVLISGLTLIIGISTLTQNLRTILTTWGQSMQMSAYLTDEAGPEDISQIEKFLMNSGKIEKVKLVTPEGALSDFREQMAAYAPDLLANEELLKVIPASFQFSLDPEIAGAEQLATMQSLAHALKDFPGVEEVSYGQDWVKNYSEIVAGVQWFGWLVVFMVTIGGLFVIANMIRTSISQRREEIEVLELIGASRGYIRWPFVIEGAFLGFVASVFSVVLAAAAYEGIISMMESSLSLYRIKSLVQFAQAPTIAVVVVTATLFCALSAWLCVSSLNSGWAASQKGRRA